MPRSDVGLLFVGDWLPRKGPDYRGLLGGMAVVGNLECAIAERAQPTDKAYRVVRDPSILRIVRGSGFAALNLANNHTADAGARALGEMAERVQGETGAAPYGLRRRPVAELAIDGARCAVIGCMERSHSRSRLLFPEETVDQEIRKLRDDYDAVFVTPHWGKEGEYAAYPSPRQRRLARRWMDAGAQGILGHHSHTVQGREVVEGRPVFYSLGNFDFDHAEGRDYSLTQFGLAVAWRPTSPPRWEERFLWHGSGGPRAMADQEAGPLREYLEKISARITDPREPWGLWTWARSVGPVYMSKSARSWGLRFAGHHRAATLVKWLAWNCVPTTLCLRLGSWVPMAAPELPPGASKEPRARDHGGGA
jgi:poly-gamma-glutamate synthesis protein (capsule biosynthesis protein)